MAWQPSPYTIPLALAAGIAVTMFVLALTQRGRKGAVTMMGLFGTMSLYAGAYALQLGTSGLGLKLLFFALATMGPAFVTLAFFVFALQYTGRDEIVTPRVVVLLALVPIVTTVLVWTDVYGFHDFFLASASLVERAGLQQLTEAPGPWYLVHALYSLGLTAAAIGLFASHWQNSEGAARKRSRIFAISGLIPVAASVAHVGAITAIDWGPVTYVITGLMLIFAIFYY